MLFQALIVIFISSCSSQMEVDDFGSMEFSKEMSDSGAVTSHGTGVNLPQSIKRKILLDKYAPSNIQLSNLNDNRYENLGFGYDPKADFQGTDATLQLESPKNIKDAILNMYDISTDPYSRFSPYQVNIRESSFQAYSFVDTYASLSSYFRDKSSSFSASASASIGINDFLFSMSAKFNKSSDSKLNFHSENYSNVARTSASQKIITRSLSLTIPPKRIITPEKHLSPTFNIFCYTSSPAEIEKYYGTFLLQSYQLGGSASINVIYGSKTNKSNETIIDESTLLTEVAVKSIFKVLDAGGNNVHKDSIARYNEIANQYDFSNTYASSFGGLPLSFTDFPVLPHEAKGLNFPTIDLTTWSSSVEGRDVLVQINPNGIVPIYDIIREVNIARNFKEYLEKGNNHNPGDIWATPKLLYRNGYVCLCLITRFNDFIILDQFKLPETGYEWWLYFDPDKSLVKTIEFDSGTSIMFQIPKDLHILDLTSPTEGNKPNVRFCKIKGSPVEEDFTYILFYNRKDKMKIGLRVLDMYAEESGIILPDNVEYINNVDSYTIYGL